jgi:hypothetical protein
MGLVVAQIVLEADVDEADGDRVGLPTGGERAYASAPRAARPAGPASVFIRVRRLGPKLGGASGKRDWRIGALRWRLTSGRTGRRGAACFGVGPAAWAMHANAQGRDRAALSFVVCG